MNHKLEDTRIVSQKSILTPRALQMMLPSSQSVENTVNLGRRTLEAILRGDDTRHFMVVGPCSLHDPKAALEYAQRLVELSARVSSELVLVMRVYFEKPRTTVGWKGLINDPHMDDSFDIETGLRMGRQLMLDINALGLPVGTEALDPVTPQYLGDLISWSAIGARTTESQTHREMASGLSTPVGFKNGTDGNLQVALNAMLSAAEPHAFLGIDHDGQVALTKTSGNAYAHLILRGGSEPNYEARFVRSASEQMTKAGLAPHIVVDCSHANSSKRFERQRVVLDNVVGQIMEGERSIMGLMLESNLVEGNQKMGPKSSLVYGQSITDACLGWEDTSNAILETARTLSGKRK